MIHARWLFVLLTLAAAPAAAQSLPAAIADGTVGERFDGYMGFAGQPSAEVRRQVGTVNIKRRNLYIRLAAGKNASADLVAMTTACELFARIGVGQAYMLQDGQWRRLAPGQPQPQPDFCR